MSEWRRVSLAEVVKLKRGFDLPETSRQFGTFPVVGSAGVSGWHNEGPVAGPGVTLGRSGASIGVATYVDARYWPLNTTLFVEDFRGNDPRFIYYLLRTIDFNGFNSGSAQPSLNRNYIAGISIRLPEPIEQRLISGLLGALDDKIAINERTSQTAAALALAEGHRILSLSNGEEVALAEKAEIVKGVSYRSADLESGDNALVTLKCVGRDGAFQSAGLKPYSGVYKDSQIVNRGDIIVAQTDLTQRADVIGRAVRVMPLNSSGLLVASLDLIVVRPGPGLSREILFAILSTQEFRDHVLSYCNGTTVLHMGARALPEYRFRMPNEETVKVATDIMAPLFEKSDSVKREIDTLARLRDALLPGLMSGAIRIRDAEKFVEDAT
ncbi:restriction endonuclease subunit S [Micromonospora globbae]|uniref:restriction endonuclease subunit S n=1 Tax=Micromonospora globbae TaxID=1894969 RepID=UPI0037A37A91